ANSPSIIVASTASGLRPGQLALPFLFGARLLCSAKGSRHWRTRSTVPAPRRSTALRALHGHSPSPAPRWEPLLFPCPCCPSGTFGRGWSPEHSTRPVPETDLHPA